MKISFSKSLKKIFLENFLLRWTGNILGLFLATYFIPGISFPQKAFWVLVLAGFVFSLINIIIKPLLVLFSISAIIFTFGLFMFIINAFLLYFVSFLIPYFQIENFSSAFLGALIISGVNFLISSFIEDFQMKFL